MTARRILTRNELEEIRYECRKRYRTVGQAADQHRDPAKSYGNWAGPTIESLLVSIELLQARILEEAKWWHPRTVTFGLAWQDEENLRRIVDLDREFGERAAPRNPAARREGK